MIVNRPKEGKVLTALRRTKYCESPDSPIIPHLKLIPHRVGLDA